MNLRFDHAAIPARVVLERLRRHEEAMSNSIARSEIGAILANSLIKRCHASHNQRRQSPREHHGAEGSPGTGRFQTLVRAEQTRSACEARSPQSKSIDRQCSSCRADTGFPGRRTAARRALSRLGSWPTRSPLVMLDQQHEFAENLREVSAVNLIDDKDMRAAG